jgi:hypothetical protein
MEVFVVVYKAEFDNEEFDDVYVYDTFDKANKTFTDIIDGWLNENLFDVEKPTSEGFEWNDDKYIGFFHKDDYNNAYLYIEETNNVANYLSVRVEHQNVK